MADVMKHEFLLGFIKIYILQYTEKEPVYGKEIHDHLTGAGYHLSYGTLYNTFHGLENKGYLIHEDCNVGGKIRKYYNITEMGKEALMMAMEQVEILFTDLHYTNKKTNLKSKKLT